MDIARRAKQISPSLTLEITARAKKMKADNIPVVSFAAGEPDFNTPDYIIQAGHKALELGMTKYTPASGTAELKAAICEKLKNDNALEYLPSQIVVSNGGKHSLFNAFMAVLEVGDEVIIPAPYWLSYPEIVKMAGGVPVYVQTKPENNFKITAVELENAITDKTKAFILNNPNNPTGAVYTRSELNALASVIEKHEVYVVSDEIYEKLNYEHRHHSIAAYSDILKDRTIVVNGMSKTYSMTGWRVGYSASNEKISSAMASMQSHSTSNINAVAQYASYIALSDKYHGDAFLEDMRATFDARRALMMLRLSRLGLKFIEPKGAFYVMVSIKQFQGMSYEGQRIRSAHDLALSLLDNAQVAVIPCESFGAPDYIRLSYAASEKDIERGLDKIAVYLEQLK
ncbi:MAG: pyridoxal phosphate-dependent aminotransferase [Clostridia bacterium]|jgi:aspartate aminotransferase|nr:pyridoxal phosphate-dependent aminotransferase [Clostridia bacterium]MCI9459136.1 pyridoxal phosphate-dependent aminotransferase [Clostridia bacterium]